MQKISLNDSLIIDKVEIIVANGEITHYKQFSFCHNDFKSCLLQSRQKAFICEKGLTMKEDLRDW